MPSRVIVSTPSRLHFGLFSIGNLAERQFGGVGLMIDRPRTKIVATRAERFSVQCHDPDLAITIRNAVTRCLDSIADDNKFKHDLNLADVESLPVSIEAHCTPDRHSGFGSGTQIALSTAAAIFKWFELPVPTPVELATILGRGKKSAIGTHGFGRGGFLVDRGKATVGGNEPVAPLDFQTSFPEAWRILTIQLDRPSGLSGTAENTAFEKLAPTPENVRQEMIEIVRNRMIPGVLQMDISLFGKAAFDFGRKSGMMYEAIQDGPYNGSEIQVLVDRIRELGVEAVGQSSWGPCVFAIVGNHKQARNLKQSLTRQYGNTAKISITRANNRGARIVTV